MNIGELNATDKLIKAKVLLQKENPFFSYLAMHLRMVEKEEIGTCAVDNRGNLYYNPKWIDKLNFHQAKTLLCHEVLHVALLHLTRKGERHHELWNIATDIIINNTLVNNNFRFGGELDKGILPYNNKIKIFDIQIDDLDKKFAEEVYAILNKKSVRDKIKSGNGFDIHIYDDGKPLTPEEKEALEKEWKQKLAEATAYSKMQGNLPAGMERYIDDIMQSKLNWRELLYRYITQEIMCDYSYNYPSKKSQAVGIYMPRIKKDLIDITIAVDTSGSISREELTEFLSETIAIGKSFESIRLNVFFMDTAVNNHYVVQNGQIDDILNYQIKGGGGTDFSEVYNYVDREIPNTRLLIFFTDGFAEFPKSEEKKTIWILTKSGCPESNIPFGETMRLE